MSVKSGITRWGVYSFQAQPVNNFPLMKWLVFWSLAFEESKKVEVKRQKCRHACGVNYKLKIAFVLIPFAFLLLPSYRLCLILLINVNSLSAISAFIGFKALYSVMAASRFPTVK